MVKEREIAAFRRDNLGFVFQDFSLLDTFSLEDNICLPLVLAGKSRTEMRDRLSPLAYDLGIETLLKKYPYEVSGGQKQRAAVARKSRKLFNFAAFTANQRFKIDIAHLQITPSKAVHITGNGQICFAFYAGLPVNGKQTVQINSIFFKPF